MDPKIQDEIDHGRRDLAGARIAGETHVLLARPAEQGGNPPEGASILAAIAPKHIKVRPESPVVSGVSA
jgi:hypothetical protein